MEAVWTGRAAQVCDALALNFAGELTDEQREHALLTLKKLANHESWKMWGAAGPGGGELLSPELALGVRLGHESVHALILLPGFWVLVRFVGDESATSLDIDLAARQALTLAASDAMQGQRVFACVVPLYYEGKPLLQGQVYALSPQRLPDYITSISVKREQGETPPIHHVQRNVSREAQWAAKRKKDMKNWIGALMQGRLDDAGEIAENLLRRYGYALYVTQDFEAARRYVAARKGLSRVFFSPKAHNLLAFRRDAQNLQSQDGTAELDLRMVIWGDDLRWAGRWRASGGESMAFYEDMLLCCDGVVVVVPLEAQMMGSLRALRDAGLITLDA